VPEKLRLQLPRIRKFSAVSILQGPYAGVATGISTDQRNQRFSHRRPTVSPQVVQAGSAGRANAGRVFVRLPFLVTRELLPDR
jgi:hypothetical protein